MSDPAQPFDGRKRVADRLPASVMAGTLLVGDLVALFAFVAVGQYRHGYVFWEYPARTVVIFAPIACPWLVCAPVAGVVTGKDSDRGSVPRVVSLWSLVAVVSGLLRKTVFVPGTAPLSFFLVSVVFGAFFVGGWRLIALAGLTRLTD